MATVEQLQNDAQTYATDLGDKIDTLINELKALGSITQADQPSVTWAAHQFVDLVTAEMRNVVAKIPLVPSLQESPAGLSDPSLPSLIEPQDPPDVAIPDFTAAAPQVNLPSAPSGLGSAAPPAAAPTINSVSTPSAPSVLDDLPAVPTFQQLAVPAPPGINMPVLSATAPNINISAPTNNFSFAETPYASELLDRLGEKLLSDLENGGYGIETADEALLIDRAEERESAQAERLIDEAARDVASRRFELPPGALLETTVRVREANAAAVNALSREIAIKRYDQLFAARQFALQQGVALENLRMSFHGAMMERMLNAARVTAEIAIAYFNVQVEEAKLRQATYEHQVRVYETLIRGELAKLEVFRAQLEAERLKGALDEIKVQQYRAQVEALVLAHRVFETEMQGARIQQENERLKLDVHRAAIETYAARLRADEVRMGVFEAQVRGEEAKVRVYQSQAQAHASVVSAKEAQVQVHRLKINNRLEINRGRLEKLRSEIDLYRTKFDNHLAKEGLKVRKYENEIADLNARTRIFESAGQLSIATYKSNTEDFLGVLRHNLDKARYLLQLGESNRNWKGEIAAKATAFYVPLASAALSSINTLASQTTEE